MVSNRNRYVSESTTDDDMEYIPNNQNKPPRRPTRTPKCFSKNALMARENRLKKKMYINTLETQVASLKSENKKLLTEVDEQACKIDDLKKEVKYLKSIMANSEGIGKLIKAINSSTGMAVTSSLSKNLTVNQQDLVNRCPIAQAVPEANPPKKSEYSSGFDFTRHPWEDTDPSETYAMYPTPESTKSCSPEFDELNSEGLLLDLDIPVDIDNNELMDLIDEEALESPAIASDEHNYHSLVKNEPEASTEDDDDVGVCLHVSKNKVSLEFCPSCSDNAFQSWKAA